MAENEFRLLRDGVHAMKSKPPVNWIVENFLYEGSLTVLVGGPSSYKSYTMLDCGAAVASGHDWLGKKVTQGPVLIIDEDNDDRLMADRYASILRGHKLPETIPMYYICLGRYNLYDPGDVEDLQEKITETGAKLVVLDCLYKLLQNKSGNDPHNIAPLFTTLKAMSVRNDCAIVIVHHTNKKGDSSGSITIPGNSDIEASITRTGNYLAFSFNKHRRINEADAKFFAKCVYPTTMDAFTLEPASDTSSKDTTRSADTVAKSLKLNDKQYEILKYLERGNTSMRELKAEFPQYETTISNDRNALRSKGLIERVDSLSHHGGNIDAVYKITDAGEKRLALLSRIQAAKQHV